MFVARSWVYLAMLFASAVTSWAQSKSAGPCPRPEVGSTVTEPQDLHSVKGVLRVELDFQSFVDERGHTRFCFLTKEGSQSPNLRVRPGDEVVLLLRNKILSAEPQRHEMKSQAGSMPCASGAMSATSTNLHFHGLLIAPVCHQDDTLNTSIQPSDPPFEYKFKIPANQPPGLYWYHPHIHGFTRAHSLGGASGALIVEGVETTNLRLTGLPERIFVIRDQELVHPDAEAIRAEPGPPPPVVKDDDDDVVNTGTGAGKPAKDVSINYVPVPFPDYQPAVIAMRPSERQFWRVLNASAITYVDLRLLYNDAPQKLELVSLDGIPLNYENPKQQRSVSKDQVLLPPAGRAEFVVTGPPLGVRATLVTQTVDTGRVGDNAPLRQIATIQVRGDAPEPRARLNCTRLLAASKQDIPLSLVRPVRQRLLYFSERPSNPNDPNSLTMFFLTVNGQEPKQFDPASPLPNITVYSGDVEDWIIENRTLELHAFHIHQTHFQLLEVNELPVSEPFLYDTINVPYWRPTMRSYHPRVKVRMDFRNPNIIGTFAYHCHLLEHQDGGMMGLIQVLPRSATAQERPRTGASKVHLSK